ncbi:TonB-linked outer membrane protein, SusC/RagA family [Saccharicrinis carchari]|uniref:TonB-linked outer membrane protein, SusC/RagA family n=1 Tax=Saccharicrinis carchari TaxID=1168039 RepID=A0A521BAG0_SACCC|nr:TonB-dependent receptor [Saccharicrinis carchari]SMO44055.1 TonB-linked outer membrane protein, SusC/RagA family [Saccharicrinis carchari]
MKNLLGTIFLFMCTTLMWAQETTVSGKVISQDDGLGMPGVSVLVKGTTIGTITSLDGDFSLQANMGETLVFSFIGMETQEHVISSSTINVVMKSIISDLDEVIVVGYGVQKKSVMTAAISSVNADELEKANPSRIEDVLKGRVSGVQITQSSGQPGADSKVRIRGVGTVNNSEPLYIVDGMAVDGGINYLNPSDIESVEVLKDAASGAIYGARAANGVILVTTKSGKKGTTKVNYDFSYGIQNPWTERDVLNATQYMVIMNEMALNDGNSARYTADQIANAGSGTDWQSKTFNYDAPVQNHQISLSGGGETSNFFLSFGYYNQEGIVGGNFDRSNFERYSVRINNTYDVFNVDRGLLKKLRVGVNAGYTRIVSSGIETNSEFGSVLGSALAFNPTVPVYATDPDAVLASQPTAVTDKNGRVYSLPPAGFQEIANPVAMLDAPSASKDNSDKIVATFWGELELLQDLKFKSSYGVDLAFWGGDGHTFPHFLASQGKHVERSHVYSNMNRGYTWQLENTLHYVKSFDDKHNFSVLLGQSAKEYTTRYLAGDDYDLLENDPNKAVIDYAIADRDDERVAGGTGGFTSRTLASYFGRLDYNFDERYMLQATVRRDGSSNFGPSNKWAIFPSFSAGWNITNESFMDNRPMWLSYMKLRASWGRNGNENIAPFSYTSLMDGGQNYYFGSGDYSLMQYGSNPSRIANADVKWEESEQIDVGMDFRLFKHALAIGVDYFKKDTKGMLMNQPIPSYVGKGAPIANAGDMENQGVELEITFKNSIGDLNYSITGQASYIKNTLINMGNDSGENIYESSDASGVGSFVKGTNGMVFPYFYGYKTAGILQNQSEADSYNSMYGQNAKPGDVRFVDYNNDDVIDDLDRTMIGKGMPDVTYGITIGADYKNFDLNVFFQGSTGNDIFDISQRGDIAAMNRPSWVLDRWTGEGTSTKIPRMTSANPNSNWRSSDLYIKDGSYMRLKNIQLGYTLPQHLVSKDMFQNIRLYVSAENLLTFTKYDGFEPEIASGGYTTIGVDKGIYPQSRTISIGANITF